MGISRPARGSTVWAASPRETMPSLLVSPPSAKITGVESLLELGLSHFPAPAVRLGTPQAFCRGWMEVAVDGVMGRGRPGRLGSGRRCGWGFRLRDRPRWALVLGSPASASRPEWADLASATGWLSPLGPGSWPVTAWSRHCVLGSLSGPPVGSPSAVVPVPRTPPRSRSSSRLLPGRCWLRAGWNALEKNRDC